MHDDEVAEAASIGVVCRFQEVHFGQLAKVNKVVYMHAYGYKRTRCVVRANGIELVSV